MQTATIRIWRVAQICLFLLSLLSLRLVYWVVWRSRDLQPVIFDPTDYLMPESSESVTSTTALTFPDLDVEIQRLTGHVLSTMKRGTIYEHTGEIPLVETRIISGNYERYYIEPSLAHTLGYIYPLSIERKRDELMLPLHTLLPGATGLERTYNDALLGLNRLDAQWAQTVGAPIVGNDLVLTIDLPLQQVAAGWLGERAGAVVVLDAHTGAVLALVSSPTFDANDLASNPICTGLDCPVSFWNRATQGRYAPGSTWKIMTLIAALDSGQVTPRTTFNHAAAPFEADVYSGCYYYQVGTGTIPDCNHLWLPELTLTEALAYSANGAFAYLGEQMPASVMVDYAHRLGFNGADALVAPPLESGATGGQLARDVADLSTNAYLRATTAIGQGELLASPLNMALVVSAVVNDGQIPHPHIIQEVRKPTGQTLSEEPHGTWGRRAMKTRTAQQVREMLIAVVEEGSGAYAAVPGLIVGGKTGTAQVDSNQSPHAWFVGFVEHPETQRAIVIAVIVEHGGEGGAVAAPIFGAIAQAAAGYLEER